MGSTVLSEFSEKNEFVDYTKERINQEASIKFLYKLILATDHVCQQ